MAVDKTSYGIDFYIEVLKGEKRGHSQEHVHGYTPNLGTSMEDVWDDGNTIMTYLSSAETINVVSDSTSDTSGGTGVRTLQVRGLDNNYNPITETITMNGTTNVTTTTAFLRVLQLKSVTVGSTLHNVGKVTATATTTTTTPQDIMGATFNHSLNGHYTTPAGKYAIFANYEANVAKGQDVILEVRVGKGHEMMELIHVNRMYQSTVFSPVPDAIIPPKTDLTFRAKSDTANSAVATACNMIVIDEGFVTP